MMVSKYHLYVLLKIKFDEYVGLLLSDRAKTLFYFDILKIINFENLIPFQNFLKQKRRKELHVWMIYLESFSQLRRDVLDESVERENW